MANVSRERRSRDLVAAAIVAVSLVAVVAVQPKAAPARGEPRANAPRIASIAVLTTRDFRVAVVARRLNGGAAPTAEVRFAVARRVGSSWRETGETRLREAYFWHTVTGPRAVCRLEIATAGSRALFRPHVTVQLLLSPSLGCGPAYRVPLAS